MIASYNIEQRRILFSSLRERLFRDCPHPDEVYVDLAGLKTVRILCFHPQARAMVYKQLGWVIIDAVDNPDATVFFWEQPSLAEFKKNALGLDVDDNDVWLQLVLKDEEGKLTPFAEINDESGFIRMWEKDVLYFSSVDLSPESLLKAGHIFVNEFYRIVSTQSSSLIHGACVGVDGNGVLLCARGSRGKSTLAVTALLQGFEYVSDDYLVLRKDEGDVLRSWPIYSFIALSHKMYNELFDELEGARFIGNHLSKEKYVLGITKWKDSVRFGYPVRACVFPEIVSDPRPQVVPCTAQEKGRAMTHLIHSTITQMGDQGNVGAVRKLIGMMQPLPFYRILLSPDIRLNAECLRAFVKQLNNK